MDNINALYPVDQAYSFSDTVAIQNEYRRALISLQQYYPDYQPFLKKTNPYTGTKIKTKRDFDEYQRQYALKLAYEKLFCESEYGRLYLTEKKNFEAQLALKEAELHRLEQSSITQVKQLEKTSRRAGHFARMAFVLVIILCVGYFKLLPNIRESSYQEGETAGYSSGVSDGYSQGYSKGESSGYSSGYSQGYINGESSNNRFDIQSKSTVGALVQIPKSNTSNNTTTKSYSSNIVYVSQNGKIHKSSNCSGMKYYTEMDYNAAVAAGYDLCSKCY